MVMVDLTERMSQADFGGLVGITQQAVSSLISGGVLPRDASGAGWLSAYCENLREQAAGRLGAVAGGPDLVDERARLTREHRAIAELRVAEMRGELIRVAAVKAVIGRAFITFRETLLQLPARLSPGLAAESDLRKVDEILSAELLSALNQLAGVKLESASMVDSQQRLEASIND